MRFYKILLLISVAIFFSCQSNINTQIELSQPEIYHLNNLPSASGISIYNNNIYIVGDDTPWLYILNNDLKIINRFPIGKVDSSVVGRVPKKQKSDFECAELISISGVDELVVISSGSLIHTRDTAFIIRISSDYEITKKNIRPLFEIIKNKAELDPKNEINIEGITISNDHIYLLHRGNVSENIIIRMKRQEALDYIKSNDIIPDIDIFNFDLPRFDGVASGFSGACITPDSSGIIFTASMEKTNDEINDGIILGSFIGIIPIDGLEFGNYSSALLMKNGALMANKLEGISVNPHAPTYENQINLITVCDNDNGTSEIIKIKMKIK